MILSHGQNHKQNPAQNHGQGPGQNITSKLQKVKILFCRFMIYSYVLMKPMLGMFMGTFQSCEVHCNSAATPTLSWGLLLNVLSQGASKQLQVIDLEVQFYIIKTDFYGSLTSGNSYAPLGKISNRF